MKSFVVAAAFAGALIAAPAQAQKVDLNTITCKEFLDSGKETVGLFLMWMDAYFRDEDSPAVIDFDKMKEIGGKLGAACAKAPTMGLLTIAEPIYEK
jgi:acid stress chaperone HdeB